MTWSTILLVVLLQAAGNGIWPATIAGWVALLASMAALGGLLIGTGKTIQRLNGYGDRLSRVENSQEEIKGAMATLQQVSANLLAAQGQLLEKIGDAKRHADECQTITRDLGIDLGSKMDELRRTLDRNERDIALQMRELTTELRTRGYIGPRAGLPRQPDDTTR